MQIKIYCISIHLHVIDILIFTVFDVQYSK